MKILHYSVMLEEVAQYLGPDHLDHPLIIDGTMGEGGHSEMFLTRYPHCRVVGLDTDSSIQKKAKERLAPFGTRVSFYHTWFNDFFQNYPLEEEADRVLLDLGISIFHYQESHRGFSFSKEEALDMRLRGGEGESAADIVNHWKQEDLANLIFELGEERYSRGIARAIVNYRSTKHFETSKELAEVIFKAVPVKYRHGRIHPATRTFQALRIQVNEELERLEKVMGNVVRNLKIGGRFGIITFHSLEDRMVKRYFKTLGQKCICPPEAPRCVCGGQAVVKVLTRKPVVATEEEIKANPPSRSAKFRVIEKINPVREM